VIQELLMAEKWAQKNNLKFPPINAKEQYQKDGLKEYYVFAHPTDPTCPVVVHFVLVNKTFKEQSYPGLFENLSNLQRWLIHLHCLLFVSRSLLNLKLDLCTVLFCLNLFVLLQTLFLSI